MPELNLDDAFDTLTTEVGERTASRGAGAAISTSRRRRTTVATSAAVALIAVGGVVFSQLGNSDDRISPAEPLPAPAVLDADAMNSITDGWVSGWHEAGKADQQVLQAADDVFACLDRAESGPNANVDPKRYGTQLLVGGSGQIAYLAYADFGDAAGAASAAAGEIAPAFATCAGNSGVTDTYDGATVTSYDLPVDGSTTTETAWVAQLDNRLSFSMVLADGRHTAAQRAGIGAALLGALQVDESFRISDALRIDQGSDTGSGYSSPGATQVAHPSMVPAMLKDALAGWSSWTAQGDAVTPDLPCLKGSPLSSSGSTRSVGSTGEMSFYDFDDATAAAAGAQQILVALAACDSGPWDIDSTTVPGAVVASHPDGTVWIAQQGSTVALFTLAGATDPPRTVKLAVGKLVIDTLLP